MIESVPSAENIGVTVVAFEKFFVVCANLSVCFCKLIDYLGTEVLEPCSEECSLIDNIRNFKIFIPADAILCITNLL